MIPDKLIVLYSKYSSQCNDIIRLYNPNRNKHIQLVCIDNIQIREQILHSTHLNVKTVPCVLFIYPDKRIEKFEGSNVKQWIIQQITGKLPEEVSEPIVSTSSRSEPEPENQSKLTSDGRIPDRMPDRMSDRMPDEISDKLNETSGNEPITPIETIMYSEQNQERQNVSNIVENSITKKKSISDLAADIAAGRKSLESEINPDSFTRR